MSASLHLVFTQGTASKTLTITEPNLNLTKPEAIKVMENIIAKKVYLANNMPVTAVKDAYLSEVVITELEAA